MTDDQRYAGLLDDLEGLNKRTSTATSTYEAKLGNLNNAVQQAAKSALEAEKSVEAADADVVEATKQAVRAEAAADRASEISGLDTVEVAVDSALAKQHLYAMTKVEFDARCEANRELYASSGFAEWGKHYDTDSSDGVPVNQGISCRDSGDALAKNIYLGGCEGYASGVSRTLEPIVNVNGCLLNVTNGAGTSAAFATPIKFPSAPDGTKSYDSADGTVIDHLTYLDPKYGNTPAADKNEAVARAFEGLVKNGDLRNGADSWESELGSTSSVVNGRLECASAASSNILVKQTGLSFKAGVDYLVTFKKLLNNQLSTVRIGGHYVAGEAIAINTVETDVSFVVKGLDASGFSIAGGGADATLSFESLEIRSVTSNPILTRKDLVFLETWREEVDRKGVLVPLGNTQFENGEWEGIPLKNLTTLGVGQGYSAFGAWDKTTEGSGIKVTDLTAAQMQKFLQDPRNNIYFDAETNKLGQVRYRIRVLEGLGDDWQRVLAKANVAELSYSQSSMVMAQGQTELPASFDSGRNNNKFTNLIAHIDEDSKAGTFRNRVNSLALSANGKVWAMPIALVQRLNIGACHPSLNPFGCDGLISQNGYSLVKWYQPVLNKLSTTKDCFIGRVGYPATSGFKYNYGSIDGTLSGRPDNDPYKFYDAIYSGLVEDLRLSAHKLDVNRLRVDAMRKAVSGEMRGKGKVPYTVVVPVTSSTSGTSSAMLVRFNPVDSANYGFKQSKYDIWSSGVLYKDGRATTAWFLTDNAAPVQVGQMNFSKTRPEENYAYITKDSGASFTKFPANQQGWIVFVQNDETPTHSGFTKTLTAEFDELPWTDIIGSPENIAATFPNGVVGQWIPQIPDGSTDKFSLNSKSVIAPTNLRTIDNGATWTQPGQSFDAVTNSITNGGAAVITAVTLLQYSTPSNFTEADNNSVVIGDVGDVSVTSHAEINTGNRLNGSLTHNIGKSVSYYLIGNTNVITSCIYSTGKLSNAPSLKTTHGAFIQNGTGTANDSPAVKALSTVTEKDGLLYLQLHGRELHYDATATNWGDDSQIPIINKESTMTDDNGYRVKTFCHKSMLPLGIAYNN